MLTFINTYMHRRRSSRTYIAILDSQLIEYDNLIFVCVFTCLQYRYIAFVLLKKVSGDIAMRSFIGLNVQHCLPKM